MEDKIIAAIDCSKIDEMTNPVILLNAEDLKIMIDKVGNDVIKMKLSRGTNFR